MNILLVDDSLIIRTVLQNMLSKHPHADSFTFFLAENGKLALDTLKKHAIDIMFLDWHMPVMTGEELVYKMRESKKFNKVRVIMATTEGGKEAVVKMAKKGVNGYLVKPFNHENVIKTFDSIYSRISKE